MPKRATADLPLHPGKAPRWLFDRMVNLTESISEVILIEYNEDELLRRLSNPFWFQAFSCVLGFDWHSSGTTTVTCGALKMAIKPEEHGIVVVGGKGKHSRKAPQEIEDRCRIFHLSDSKVEALKYSSKMSAKVDNTAIQDNYQLYHHTLIFTENGRWCVIQQGMNPEVRLARRYHWLSDDVESFIEEPHTAILCQRRSKKVLDMTSGHSKEAREISVDLVNDGPGKLRNLFREAIEPRQRSLYDYLDGKPRENYQNISTLIMPKNINWNLIRGVYEFQPRNYEEFLGIKGVGPKTVRALALVSELVYGTPPSWNDPVKYSFAVGGKDGVPYPVDRKAMDESIDILKAGVEEAKVNDKEKLRALKRLRRFVPEDIENY